MTRKLISMMAVTGTILSLAAPAVRAEDNGREAILAALAAQARAEAPSFTTFSAQQGEALFRGKWTEGDSRTPSCTACHTDDPRGPGRNAKTGRKIGPVAVSADPKRFTNAEEVEKHFRRDCKSVLNRACTAQEKGDYITFMTGR